MSGRRFHFLYALAIIPSVFFPSVARAQVNLTPAQLFPPDDSAWTLSGVGVNGTVAFKMLAEQTGAATANSLLFDIAKNGFPGPVGTTTDDVAIFTGADTPAKIVTVSVPVGANLALFHDVTDATGVFLSGPDGILDVEDAYINSNPARNITRAGTHQLLKYYGADQFTTYQFTSFGQTIFLGTGYVAFIFVEEDHNPNYDYNDMIIGILPSCVEDANCNDGLFCNGTERCAFPNTAANNGVCMGGTPPACDDGVACTFDECLERPGGFTCVFKPHDQNCDDQNFCNGVETCDPVTGCVPGKPVNCDDGVDCTIDTCVDKGTCLHTADDSLCSDGQFCNGAETCHRKNGCEPGTPPTCNDGIPCTADSCDPVSNACKYEADNFQCDDGLFCNGAETCDPALGCQPGAPPSCDDGIPCTVDSCDPASNACKHVADDSLCANGLFCDGVETCNPQTGCVPGTPVECADAVPCTVDACDEATDACTHQPDSSQCRDATFCNGEEICDPVNGCQDGPDPDCSDGIPCTLDSCDAATDACKHVADDSICNNGLFCDGTETCDPVTGCVPGTPPNCDDGVPCTVDSCDETQGACLHQPDSSFCNDGLHCNGVEICDPQAGCIPGTPVDCADSVTCTVDACDEATDSCTHVPDSSLCVDSVFCNGVEFCDLVNGCQLGPAPDCSDGIPCTVDTCNPQTDACQHVADDSLCIDALFCNGVETCNPQTGCVPGTPPNCDDGVLCTVDSCDDVSRACLHVPDSSFCMDDFFCNGLEQCDVVLGCQPGTPIGCSDGVGCTLDVCDETADQCVTTPDSSLCDDGAYCNGEEFCDPAIGCQNGPAPSCDDGIDCTVDLCNSQIDGCEHVPNDSLCANGLFCDGTEICIPSIGCVPGTPPNCGDILDCTLDSCDEANDQCIHVPQPQVCDDGLFCNGPESCDPQVGCVDEPDPCLPSQVCDEPSLSCQECFADGDCLDDHVFCNGRLACQANKCVPVDIPDCADARPCTVDRCDGVTDMCVHEPDNTLCNDGQFCNGTEVCDPLNGCQPGTPVDCDDGIACTTDQCDVTTDQCTHTPGNTFCNDGLFCNGTEVCHPTQGCLPGTPINCIDGFGCTADSCNEATDTCDHLCSIPQITCTNQQFECDNVGTFLPPVVNDPCSVNPVAMCTDVTTPGKIPQEYTVTRTCSFTNDCGNSATCTQVVKIEDTTPPQVTCPPNRQFECDAIGDPGQPIVSDNCNPDPIVILTTEIVEGDCTPPNAAGISPPPKLIKLNTYTVSDGIATLADGATADGDTTGNTTTCTQRIEIIDTHGPVFLFCPPSVSGCAGQPLVFTPPDCNDPCGPCSTVCTRSDGLPLSDPVPAGPLSIHCVAKDECENSSAPCDIAVTTEQCEDIPTVSQWGLVVLALLLLIAAKLRFTRFADLARS